MLSERSLPEFAVADWYTDPSDHRCPHDAWLESCEVCEPACGERKEKRTTSIKMKLLGAYHDGFIVFRYSGVTKYTLGSDSSGRGLGDWLHDEFSLTDAGLLSHRITWNIWPDRKAYWIIEAEEVAYQWVPKEV